MTSTRLLLVFLGLVGLSYQDGNAPKVKTPLGGIRGYYKVSANGRHYEAYEGIPYALPPIGKLRFKPPQNIPPWIGELPATKFGSPCLQFNQVPTDPSEKVEGAEDCLYLNIYVPVRNVTGFNIPLLPVLFWIHSGAFQFGSGNFAGAKYLMDRDIVFVSINYRLGALGFLSTEDEVLPGNNGLKDQSMALRWVYENIEWFGGDPEKITLAGLSAGAASVHYHYLSPMSAGLFRGGISISGTAFNCWTQTENAAEKAKKLGAVMGCPTDSSKEMMRCLKYRPARTLVQATSNFMPWLYNPFTPFGPVAEKSGNSPFIDRSPAEIVKSGDAQDIPWITGVVSEEGLYPVAEFCTNSTHLKELNDNWEIIAPHFLDYNYTLPSDKHVQVARLIKSHYFGSKQIDRNTVASLIRLASDRFFAVGSEAAARMQAEANQRPVWYYYYTYRGAHSLSDAMSHTTENLGVSHGDDAFLVLDTPYLHPVATTEDRKMQQELIDFWLSFVIEGIPRVPIEWPKLDPTKKELYYLHIASPGKYSIESDTNFGDKQFWSSIDLNENKADRVIDSAKDEF